MHSYNRDKVSLDFKVGQAEFDQPIQVDMEAFFLLGEDVSNGLMALECKHGNVYDELPANMDFVAWL
jgi:hypothetical protein